MEIEIELGIPLQELAMELIPIKKNQKQIVNLLDHQPKKAEDAVKKMVANYIKNEGANVTVTNVEFREMDSANLNHGAAYFAITLRGNKKELEKTEGLNGVKQSEDWTEPEHLEKRDHLALKEIQRLYKSKKYKEAMSYAMSLDTIVREEVPGDIWKKLGGQLTKTGEEKLRARKSPQPIEKTEVAVKKKHIVFNYGVRLLKELYERYLERELTDSDYIKMLEIAENNDDEFVDLVSASHVNLMKFLDAMNKALKEVDKQ